MQTLEHFGAAPNCSSLSMHKQKLATDTMNYIKTHYHTLVKKWIHLYPTTLDVISFAVGMMNRVTTADVIALNIS